MGDMGKAARKASRAAKDSARHRIGAFFAAAGLSTV
jgi:hypothetical protein